MRHAVFALLLTACVVKSGVDPTIYEGVSVATAVVHLPMDRREAVDAPAELSAGVTETLASWGANTLMIPSARFGEAFTKRRVSGQRLAWVAEEHPTADMVMLVEAEAHYFSQLQGRFRWVVQVSVSIAEVNRPQEGVSESFAIPVFMQFQHQREADAIAAASGVINRRISTLLDDLSGRLPSPDAP